MHLGVFSNLGRRMATCFKRKTQFKTLNFQSVAATFKCTILFWRILLFVFPFPFDAWTVHSELFEITETQEEYAFTCLPKCFLQEGLSKHLQTSTMLLPYTTGLYFTNFILFKEIKYKLWTQRLEYLRCGRWMGLLKVP